MNDESLNESTEANVTAHRRENRALALSFVAMICIPTAIVLSYALTYFAVRSYRGSYRNFETVSWALLVFPAIATFTSLLAYIERNRAVKPNRALSLAVLAILSCSIALFSVRIFPFAVLYSPLFRSICPASWCLASLSTALYVIGTNRDAATRAIWIVSAIFLTSYIAALLIAARVTELYTQTLATGNYRNATQFVTDSKPLQYIAMALFAVVAICALIIAILLWHARASRQPRGMASRCCHSTVRGNEQKIAKS